MSLPNPALHLLFLKDKELNRFYGAISIISFGGALINIFVPIYLYRLGFPVYAILGFYLLVSLFFVILAYPSAEIVARIGKKHAILYSTPFLVAYYLGLTHIGTVPALFFILPLLLAAYTTLFNLGYHLNFITHAPRQSRGTAITTLNMLVLVVTTLAPYLGGVLAGINFPLLFGISSLCIIVGAVPLVLTQDGYEPLAFSFNGLFKYLFARENLGNLVSFWGYAIESIIGRTVWPVFLIIIIGSLSETGLVVAASAALSLLVFSVVGRLTDRVSRVRLLRFGTMLYVFGWVGRLFADTAVKVFFIDSYKNLSQQILQVPWSAHSYDLAERTNYFEFIVSQEVAYNTIRVLVIPVLMLLFWLDVAPFLVSFLIASVFSIGYAFINT